VTSTSDIQLDLSGTSRCWRPAPLIWLTLLLHAGAVVLLLTQPALWPWIVGVLVCNHLLLTGAVLWPKGQLLGPNLTRLPTFAAQRNEVALTFDDGPDPEITPQVLDLLDRYQAKASFFCIGEKAVAFPDIVKDIVRRGHSVENHSYHHPHAFSFFGTQRLRHEVRTAQTAITGIAGRAPLFFRAPAGFRSPMLDPVLARAGLHYASWTRRGLDGVKSDPAAVLRRLTADLAAGDVLLLHDGAREPVVLTVLPALLEQMAAQGLKSVSLPAGFAA